MAGKQIGHRFGDAGPSDCHSIHLPLIVACENIKDGQSGRQIRVKAQQFVLVLCQLYPVLSLCHIVLYWYSFQRVYRFHQRFLRVTNFLVAVESFFL